MVTVKPHTLTIKPTVLALLFLLCGWVAHAQVLVETRYSSTQMMHLKDLRNFSLSNASGAPFQCIIRIEVTQDDQLVTAGETAPVLLPTGNTNLLTWNGALIQHNTPPTAGKGPIRADGTFAGGAYMACIKILDVKDRAELAVNCEGFSVMETPAGKPGAHPTTANGTDGKEGDKKKFPVQFHGNAEISGYFANRPPMYSDYAPNYGHVYLNPTLSIYDVPLTGTVLVASQNSPLRQNMNVFNFSFDAETFKANLIARLQKALTENKKLNELTGGKMATLGKLQNLDNLMKNPEVQKELQGLKDLDSYRDQLGEIQEINKFLGQGDSITGMLNGAGNYTDMAKGLGNTGNYANMAKGLGNTDSLGNLGKGLGNMGNYADMAKGIGNTDSLANLGKGLGNTGNYTNMTKGLGNTDSLGNMGKGLGKGMGKTNGYTDLLKSMKDSLDQADSNSIDTKKLQHRYDSLQTRSDSLQRVYQKYQGKADSLRTVSDSLTKLVDKLKHLDYKKGGYDALLKQQDGLLKDAKLNGWVDSLGNVKNTADELSKVDMSKVNDPNYLTGKLGSMGLLKKYEKYLSWIRKFSVGTSFAQYSDYSLNNVPVTGISVELAPWKLYAAFTYGEVQRSVLTDDPATASYKRKLISGSVGYGTQDKTHIHFNVLSAQDDPNSINPRDSVYLYYKKPQSNKVISADFALNFWKDRIRISGELAGSQLVRDVTYQPDSGIVQLQDTVLRSEKDWVANIFRQKPVNLNAVTDYAFFAKAEATLFKDKTRISFGASRVGENYYSFGTPFLMRDLLTFEGKVSQKFLKNKISASLYVRQMSNNLSGNKPLTVNQWRWGGDLTLNFPKMPVVRIMYTPILQETDSGTVNMNMMSANVSYPIKVKKVRITNMGSYIFQNGTKGFSAESFTTHFASFNQNIQFSKGQTLGFTLNYIYSKSVIEELHSLAGTLSAGGTLFKKWNNGGGVNIYANAKEQRYMLFYRTGISFLKYLTLNIQIEGQIYRNGRPDALYPQYDVIAVRPLLNVRW